MHGSESAHLVHYSRMQYSTENLMKWLDLCVVYATVDGEPDPFHYLFMTVWALVYAIVDFLDGDGGDWVRLVAKASLALVRASSESMRMAYIEDLKSLGLLTSRCFCFAWPRLRADTDLVFWL